MPADASPESALISTPPPDMREKEEYVYQRRFGWLSGNWHRRGYGDGNRRQNRNASRFRSFSVSICPLICLVLCLTACREEELIVPIDTSDWPEISLGYHRFRSPPDFTKPEMTATIGTASLSILRGQSGTAADIVGAQDDVGEIVRHLTVGEWEILVTREDMGLVVSSYTFLVFGVRRVGQDIVLTRDSMSQTQFPGADDAEKWLFHSLTKVYPLTERGAAQGFVFDDLFFETSYLEQQRPGIEARFAAHAGLIGADGGSGSDSFTSNSYDLAFLIEPAQSGEGERPLAMPTDIASLLGVNVKSRSLQLGGAEVSLSRVTMTENGERETWFDASLFWFGDEQIAPETLLTSAHMKFINAIRTDAEAEERALGLLTSITQEK